VSAATEGAEVDACKVFAAMSFDVSTQQAVAKTQDQINAGLNLLPQNDPLRSDMVCGCAAVSASRADASKPYALVRLLDAPAIQRGEGVVISANRDTVHSAPIRITTTETTLVLAALPLLGTVVGWSLPAHREVDDARAAPARR